MGSLVLELPGLGLVKVDIHEKRLFEFTRRQLSLYALEEEKVASDEAFVRINIQGDFQLIPDIKISREFNFRNGRVEFTRKFRAMTLSYRYRIDSTGIDIEIQLTKRLAFLVTQLKRGYYGLSHFLFYNSILFPIFSLHSIIGGYYLLHGSVLKIGSKVILLSGLDGVGKSSLAASLVNSGAELICDNFVLYNGHTCMPLNLPVRLERYDGTIGKKIFSARQHVEVLFSGKHRYPLVIDQTYFLAIATHFSVHELKMYQGFGASAIINNAADEIREANHFCAGFVLLNKIRYGNHEMDFVYQKKAQLLSVPRGKLDLAERSIMCQVDI